MFSLGKLQIPKGYLRPNVAYEGEQSWRQEDGKVWAVCRAKGEQRYLLLPGVGKFFFGRDLEVWGEPLDGGSDEQLRRGFVADALPLLHQANGALCFHASAVSPSGTNEALALVGPREVGKSTLARAWAQAGGDQLADDVVVLYPSGNTFVVQPIPYTSRLRKPSSDFLGVSPGKNRLAFAGSPKLSAIVLVEQGASDRSTTELITVGVALPDLLDQALCFLLDSAMAKKDFFLAHTDLLSKVPCWRLRNSHRFDALPATLAVLQSLA